VYIHISMYIDLQRRQQCTPHSYLIVCTPTRKCPLPPPSTWCALATRVATPKAPPARSLVNHWPALATRRCRRGSSCYCTSLFFLHQMIWAYIYNLGGPFLYRPLPSVLWHCWFGNRKGIWWPLKMWLSVSWWWRFDWSFAHLIAPPVTSTTFIVLGSNIIQNGGSLVPA